MPLVHQVEQASRRADDDVDAGRQRGDLGLVGPPSVDGQHPRPQCAARSLQVLGDLKAQLPGGDDHQCLRPGIGRGLQPLEKGHTERQSLTRAGACLPDDVVTAQGDGNRHLLNREGDRDSHVGQGSHRLGPDAHVVKVRCLLHRQDAQHMLLNIGGQPSPGTPLGPGRSHPFADRRLGSPTLPPLWRRHACESIFRYRWAPVSTRSYAAGPANAMAGRPDTTSASG